jgi:hypothetical protein
MQRAILLATSCSLLGCGGGDSDLSPAQKKEIVAFREPVDVYLSEARLRSETVSHVIPVLEAQRHAAEMKKLLEKIPPVPSTVTDPKEVKRQLDNIHGLFHAIAVLLEAATIRGEMTDLYVRRHKEMSEDIEIRCLAVEAGVDQH